MDWFLHHKLKERVECLPICFSILNPCIYLSFTFTRMILMLQFISPNMMFDLEILGVLLNFKNNVLLSSIMKFNFLRFKNK